MMNSNLVRFTVLPIVTLAAVACASQSQPAPETPASQPAAAEEGGEHMMPDGTSMEGHQHGETGTHTMPDGTVMEGHSHGDGSGDEK